MKNYISKNVCRDEDFYRSFLVIIIPMIAIIMSACESSLKVTTDYDKTAVFSGYKTYSFYNTEETSSAISQLNKDRIVTAIRSEMLKKGFRETTSSPDLLINPIAVFKDKVAVSANTNYYGYGGIYRPYYWGSGLTIATTNYNVQHYKDGSLIIDIIDAASKKLLWQGVGNKEIDKPLKDPDTEIAKAISSIMAGFPPGANKK